MMLTTFNICVTNMYGMSDIILHDSVVLSQQRSHKSYRTEGLRVLARLIAHDLLAKRRDNTTKKNDRKVGDPQISESCR